MLGVVDRFTSLAILLALAAVSCRPPPKKLGAPPEPPRVHFLPAAAVTQVALGWDDLCVRLTNGGVLCRKDFRPKEHRVDIASYVPIVGVGDVSQVALGTAHGCLRRANGVVMCWGANSAGESAFDYAETVPYPRDVAISGAASQIALGTGRSCAVLIDGHVTCWGTFAGGRRPPTRLSALTEIAEIAMSDKNLCVRNKSGQVRCARGDGPFVEVEGLPVAHELAVGREHGCARVEGGTVSCWAQKGDPTLRAVPVAGLIAATQIASGDSHVCARRSDGAVLCWGSNEYGQLGDGSRTGRSVPTPVRDLWGTVDLSAGGRRTCARNDQGTFCWGRNLLDDAMFHALTGQQSPPGPPGEDDSLVPEPLRVPGALVATSPPAVAPQTY